MGIGNPLLYFMAIDKHDQPAGVFDSFAHQSHYLWCTCAIYLFVMEEINPTESKWQWAATLQNIIY